MTPLRIWHYCGFGFIGNTDFLEYGVLKLKISKFYFWCIFLSYGFGTDLDTEIEICNNIFRITSSNICSITQPKWPKSENIFFVIFQPIRGLEFQSRLSDYSLSSKTARNCQISQQLSLLCETITYFIFQGEKVVHVHTYV